MLERQEGGKELFSQIWLSVRKSVFMPFSGRFLKNG